MSGDYSRDTFDALRDFAGVFLQQGRAALDADWNEMVAIFERRIRAGTVDTIGRAVVPRETISGFEIQPGPGPTLTIGRGRFYLDGMLLECHGRANFPGSGDDDFPDPAFDRGRQEPDGSPTGVLDELISPAGSDFLPYDRQPYWPTPEPLPDGGPHLAYLVAWQREVTPLENPALLEPALGGIDTATRWQTVWQVRLLATPADGLTCATPDAEIADWAVLIPPSTARLTTETIDIEDPEDPCLVPPTDGYTGIENQLYRVELHSVGDTQGDARFKFSRENASVAAAIESFATPADRVTVRRIGRDEILRFQPGDWVEVTDDHRELNHRSGQMLRIAIVNEETREIELEGTVDADLVPTDTGEDTPDARRSRLIRWDQRGTIRLADSTEWTDLDAAASDGLIPVPPDGTAIVLESGITVVFSTAPGPGGFREMDHWRFAARTAGTQIEELTEAPPDGVQRHYARLAVVTFPDEVEDCREFWPPEFGGDCCACTVCVSPASHNSGALTIQAAIDAIGPEGGTVCLEGGGYVLDAPVTIAGKRALTVQGQGIATLLFYEGQGAAIRVTDGVDVQLERLSLLVAPEEDDTGALPPAAGVTAVNTALLALRRLAVIVTTRGEAREDHAIAIDGLAIGAKVEECLALAPIALGSRSSRDTDDAPSFLALAELRVLDNILFGSRAAVRFEGVAINLAGAVLARNLLFGTAEGALINWFEPPSGWTAIESSTIAANADVLRLGANDLRLENNQIGGAEAGHGVRLVQNIVPELETDAQVVGNRISDLSGTGLSLEGAFASVLVKRNVIRRCGTAGIATAPAATIRHAAIDNNVVEAIADAAGSQDAGGIVLTQVEAGQIAGNAVREVGLGGTEGNLYAGIAVLGVGDLAIEGNTVAAIGPEAAVALADAILGRAPYAALSIRGNRLIGGPPGSQAQGIGWIGIDIGRLALAGQPGIAGDLAGTPAAAASRAVPGLRTSLAFAEIDGEIYAVAIDDFRVVGRVREPMITIDGNLLRNEANAVVPMVMVNDPANSSVVFTSNQCRLEAAGQTPALVLMAAPRIVAANNIVRRQSDADAMRLTVGPNGTATVLGNITFGNIRVLPGGLNPPFAPLNVLAS